MEEGEGGDGEGCVEQSVGKGETECLRVLCNARQNPRLWEDEATF